MTPVFCVGPSMFHSTGLAPGRRGYQSEALWPSAPVVGADPLYQPTGMGERTWQLRAFCRPHIMAGEAAYAAMQALHESQAVVPFISLRASYLGDMLGMVFVRRVGLYEEKWAPDSRAYRQEFDFELVRVGFLGGML